MGVAVSVVQAREAGKGAMEATLEALGAANEMLEAARLVAAGHNARWDLLFCP